MGNAVAEPENSKPTVAWDDEQGKFTMHPVSDGHTPEEIAASPCDFSCQCSCECGYQAAYHSEDAQRAKMWRDDPVGMAAEMSRRLHAQSSQLIDGGAI